MKAERLIGNDENRRRHSGSALVHESFYDRKGIKEQILEYLKENKVWPWLVWLSGLNAGLQTKRSPIRFPVRAHAWVVGQVPSWGCARGNQLMFLSHMSLPFFLPPLPSL